MLSLGPTLQIYLMYLNFAIENLLAFDGAAIERQHISQCVFV